MLTFDGAVDPLSVHAGSVAVSAEDGPLEAEVGVVEGRLVLHPVATPRQRERAPAEVTVRLAGSPAPGALRLTDGRRLARTESIRVRLRPDLADDARESPQLVEVQGQPPGGPVELRPGGRLTLLFDGVLDPDSLTPELCSLQPVVGGLVLGEQIRPVVEWRCVGRRFELVLQVPRATETLQLNLRRAGLRGLSGAAPEPALMLQVRPAD